MFNKYRKKKSRKLSYGTDFNLFEPAKKPSKNKKKPKIGIINHELDSGSIYVGLKRELEKPEKEEKVARESFDEVTKTEENRDGIASVLDESVDAGDVAEQFFGEDAEKVAKPMTGKGDESEKESNMVAKPKPEEKVGIIKKIALWFDRLGLKDETEEISFSGRYKDINADDEILKAKKDSVEEDEKQGSDLSEEELQEKNLFDTKKKNITDYFPWVKSDSRAAVAFDWIHEHIIQIIVVIVVLSGVTASVYMLTNNDDGKVSKNGKTTVMEKSDMNYIGITQPESFNALASNDEDVYYINQLVYSQLFKLDKNLNIEKDLVDSYSCDSSNGTVSITLKSGVKFSDGTSLTARDVKSTITDIKSVGSKSPYYAYASKIDSVSIDGDLNLTIEFESPNDAAVDNLIFPIVSSDSYSEKENFVIGSGPYAYSSYTEGKEVHFKINEYYYGKKAKNNLDALIIADQSQYLALMTMDAITVMLDKDTDSEEVAKDKGLGYKKIISNELEYIGFNHANAVLKNSDVRYAIAHAINVDEIIEDDYGSCASKSESIYYPGFLGTKGEGITFDQKKTSDSLKKAGFTDKDKDGLLENSDGKPLTIKLLVSNGSKNRLDAAETIKNQLETVGISVVIETEASDKFLARLKSGDFEMYLAGLKVDKQFNLTDLFGDKNFGKYNNSDVISKVAKLEMSLTESELVEAFEAAKKALNKDVPYVPICYKNYGFLTVDSYKSDSYGTFFDRYRGLAQAEWEKKVTTEDEKEE